MMISPGKQWALRRLADKNGRFKMVAIDQRPPISDPIAKALGVDEAPYDEVARVKSLLLETLQSRSSAFLLDPIYAVPRSINALDPQKGLMVTLESHKFTQTEKGRTSNIIDHWSVEKIKRLGGNGVKLLAWYRPDVDEDIRLHQQNFIRRIGAKCQAYDIPFLLELLVYPNANGTKEDDADGMIHCQRVIGSVREFAKPEYQVDLFKLESPLPAHLVPNIGDDGWEKAQQAFAEMSAIINRPWVMLSAGVSKDAFANILTHAYRAGCSGYLAGRAIWMDAFNKYPDWNGMRQGLLTDSVKYMDKINQLSDQNAQPWHDHACFKGQGLSFSYAGDEFCRSYAAFGDK